MQKSTNGLFDNDGLHTFLVSSTERFIPSRPRLIQAIISDIEDVFRLSLKYLWGFKTRYLYGSTCCGHRKIFVSNFFEVRPNLLFIPMFEIKVKSVLSCEPSLLRSRGTLSWGWVDRRWSHSKNHNFFCNQDIDMVLVSSCRQSTGRSDLYTVYGVPITKSWCKMGNT